ncbi:hypothetical protein Tco_1101554 [Tanacetum coccineum]
MAGASGSNSFVDDLIELSGKTDPNEYLKLFVTQQIADRRGFIARMGPEVNIARNELGQLNALITGLEASKDVGEVWDTIICLRDEQRKAEAKLADLQHWLTDAEEEIRYFDVDLTVRKLVMNRLGQLLRNFRTKLRRTYILPNQDTPSKLNEVPAKYTSILKAEEWVNFVKYTDTQAYKLTHPQQKFQFVKQKYDDELVKKSLLTRSQFEGQLKEKSMVISDLMVKEGKDIDTMIEMDKQIKFLNEILYKRNQSIQTIHMLAPKCATYNGRSTFANPKYLKRAQSDKPCLYEIPYDTSDPANRFCPNGEETVTLEKESRSKLDKDTVKPYNYTYQNSLYETFKPPSKAYLDQLERAKEVRKTMWRKTFVRTKPNIAKNVGFLPMSKSISKSRLLYNEMTNNFNHFRTICQQTWSNHTSSAFPNPTAKSMEVLIKILLMPLSDKTILDSHCFVHELKKEMNDDLEYVKSLEKEVDELESEKADFSNIYDLLLEECVSKDVTCSYLHSLSDLNANTELQCLYLHKVKECECLAQKLSKQTESVNKEVRIEKTKRSKNDQKPTRNGKKTKSQEQDKEISQKSQPDQPDTVKLSQRKK